MDFEYLARSVNISVKKVRLLVQEMRRKGYLPPDDKIDEIKKIKMYMNHGQGLTVAQFVMLIEQPALLKSLGAKAEAVRMEIAALGAVKDCKLFPGHAAYIMSASAGGIDAAQRLAEWTKATMPEYPVGYHYFAVRLVLGTPEEYRTRVARRLHRAYLAVCKLPDFQDWFHVIEVKGKRKTIYHRPKISR